MSSLAVHIYINGSAVNACEFNKTKSNEFRTLVLAALKPVNKNHYLELDMDTHDEYGILTCTDERDNPITVPSDVSTRTNKYIAISPSSAWTHGNLKILMSFL
jgi:hypothetical protein